MKECQFIYLEQYLAYLKVIKERSPATIDEYLVDNTIFLKWIIKQRKFANQDVLDDESVFLNSITLNDMLKFISYCQSERNMCAGSRIRKIVSIRQFWRYLKKSNIIKENVAEDLEMPKAPTRIPKYLSLEESVRLLMACKAHPRDHCIITLLLNCALRISELQNLKVDSVSHDIIHIIGKGNKERKIFLTPAAKTAVCNWLAVRPQIDTDKTALFISKHRTEMTIKALQDVVKKYVILAGLDPYKISPHTLRHTSATLMYKYGKVDIRSLQQILGHSSIATTEIYTHVDDSQLQTAVNSNPLAIMFN